MHLFFYKKIFFATWLLLKYLNQCPLSLFNSFQLAGHYWTNISSILPKTLVFCSFFFSFGKTSHLFFFSQNTCYLHICFSFAQILRFVPNYHFFAQLSMFCPNITFVCLTLFYYVFISKLLVLFVCFFALISLMLCSNTTCLNYQSVFLMIPIICPSHFLNWKHYPHIYASIWLFKVLGFLICRFPLLATILLNQCFCFSLYLDAVSGDKLIIYEFENRKQNSLVWIKA